MTKRREPLTYHRALTTVAARIGWDTCAALCGVSERAVRYWSDPDCETEIGLLDAERLDRAYLERAIPGSTPDYAPFHHTMAQRLDLAAREGGQVASLAALAATSAKESGEAVTALIAASGNASPQARRMAREELAQAIDAMQAGLAALDVAGDAA